MLPWSTGMPPKAAPGTGDQLRLPSKAGFFPLLRRCAMLMPVSTTATATPEPSMPRSWSWSAASRLSTSAWVPTGCLGQTAMALIRGSENTPTPFGSAATAALSRSNACPSAASPRTR